jgi:Tfp pilus assembly protein PilF
MTSSSRYLRNTDLFISLILVSLTLLVYWQVQNHEFILWDDQVFITENSHVTTGLTLENMKWAFTTTYPDYWHPLPWLSHMLDYEIYGQNPKGHHFNNLLFHIANTLLLFFVFKRMTGHLWESAFIAALFGIHPIQVESVAWVTERKDVLSALFWILTLGAYTLYAERPGIRRYLALLLCFILGLMAKPMLVTLPFVLLLLDYWPLGRTLRSPSSGKSVVLFLILEKTPLFLLSLSSGIATYLAAKSAGAVLTLNTLPIDFRIGNAVISYVSYIGKMIWPSQLAYFYPLPVDDLSLWQATISLLLLISITIVSILVARRLPFLIVGWLWYLGTLLPVVGLIQVGLQSMADRFAYMPLIGLYIVVAWFFPRLFLKWRDRKAAISLICCIALSALSICTWFQLKYWKNSITLFEHALDVTPRNYTAHFHIANALLLQGSTKEAIDHYREAITIKPDYVEVYHNLGAVLAQQGEINEAMKLFHTALRLNQNDAQAYYNLGNLFASQGEIDKAELNYRLALQINPSEPRTHNNLGLVLMQQKKFEAALCHFSEALKINPEDQKAAHNTRAVNRMLGRESP